MRAFHGLIKGVVLSVPLWAAIVLAVVLLTGRPTASAPHDVTLPSTPEAISACVARTLGVAPPAVLPTIEYVPAEKVAWYRREADAVYLTTAQGTVFLAVHDLPLLAHELTHHIQHLHGLDPSSPGNEAQAAWVQANFTDLCASS